MNYLAASFWVSNPERFNHTGTDFQLRVGSGARAAPRSLRFTNLFEAR